MMLGVDGYFPITNEICEHELEAVGNFGPRELSALPAFTSPKVGARRRVKAAQAAFC